MSRFLGRIHRSRQLSTVAYCYTRSSVVCLLATFVSPVKRLNQKMPFGGGRQTRVVPRNHVLDGGQGRTNPFSRGDNALWHRRVGGSSSAVMPLLRFELSLLLHTPQQTPNAFKGRTSPTFFLPVRGFWLPSSNEWVRSFNRISAHYRLFNTWFRKPTSQFNKRNLDPFSRFCTAHPCAQHTHTHTHTHSASVWDPKYLETEVSVNLNVN